MEFDSLLRQPCEWLRDGGKEEDIVISTRFRLARNVSGFPFSATADSEQFKKIEGHIARRLKQIPALADYRYLPLDELSASDISLLFERHLISKDHSCGKWRRSVLFKPDESISIMINEEDHLRIQAICRGFETEQLWKDIDALDNLIESVLPYAFDRRFGYLTACPSNVGTGLRISVMLHLPALCITQQMGKIYRALGKLKLIFRGFYGEGSASLGDFFQLSNQVTLGKTERELMKNLQHVIPQILQYEREIRNKMTGKNNSRLKNMVKNSLEQLVRSESLSSEQALKKLSIIRLGIHLGISPSHLTIQDVNELFILSQPAHLQKKNGSELNAQQRDEIRAELFKNYLQAN